MSVQHSVSPHFEITTRVTYIESESRPEQSYYFFVYKISIRNRSPQSAQLLSRHWIITDANGATEEVRGPGVVGLQPKIQPNQVFEYESACPLPTPYGAMKGFYQFQTERNESFSIPIPEFDLVAPQAMH